MLTWLVFDVAPNHNLYASIGKSIALDEIRTAVLELLGARLLYESCQTYFKTKCTLVLNNYLSFIVIELKYFANS